MHRVTVIMPVHNTQKYIEQAIDSILSQTYTNFELLIIDDASTDNSIDYITNYKDNRIKLVRNKVNLGISRTRNYGIELSNTEYIALMDSDDIATPTRLEKEVRFLDENSDIDVVGGHMRQIDEDGRDLNKQWSVCLNPKYVKAYLLLGNTVANGTTMFRKSFVEKSNIRFDENSIGAEDYRFWVDCSLQGNIANLDEVFLYWRTSHDSETNKVRLNKSRELDEVNIHNYALQKTGFLLTNNETVILNKVFKDEGIIENKEELIELYHALKSISKQANKLKLNNEKEVAAMCRKRFGEKVGKAFYLWE